jgi:hypothetical protein
LFIHQISKAKEKRPLTPKIKALKFFALFLQLSNDF